MLFKTSYPFGKSQKVTAKYAVFRVYFVPKVTSALFEQNLLEVWRILAYFAITFFA
jgi:hypothetical protein